MSESERLALTLPLAMCLSTAGVNAAEAGLGAAWRWFTAGPSVALRLGPVLGLGIPSAGAVAVKGGASGQAFYRVITSADAEANFVSNAAKGLLPRGPEITNQLIYKGVSVFDSLEAAAAKVPILERGGANVLGIAQLRVIPGFDIGITKTALRPDLWA